MLAGGNKDKSGRVTFGYLIYFTFITKTLGKLPSTFSFSHLTRLEKSMSKIKSCISDFE
jgi:hypothetical protein